MHNNIAKHNIKRLACLLAANLILTSCCMLASAKTVTIRGTPGYVKAGLAMLLGFNFPELIYRIDDDMSCEWLNISFAENEMINEGDASYTIKLYKQSPKREIMFMGSTYHFLDPGNADTFTKTLQFFGSNDEKTLERPDCQECPNVSLIDESNVVDSTALTTASSNNSFNAGPCGAGMATVPTATPEQTAQSANVGSVSGISQPLIKFSSPSLMGVFAILSIIIRRK
jgi:hypothetical protein